MKKLFVRCIALALLLVMAFSIVACEVEQNPANHTGSGDSSGGSGGSGIQVNGTKVEYSSTASAAFKAAVVSCAGTIEPEVSTDGNPTYLETLADEMLAILSVSRVSENSLSKLVNLSYEKAPLIKRMMDVTNINELTEEDVSALKKVWTDVLAIVGDRTFGQLLHGTMLLAAERIKNNTPELDRELAETMAHFYNYKNGVEGYKRSVSYRCGEVAETTAVIYVHGVSYSYSYTETWDNSTYTGNRIFYTYQYLECPDFSDLDDRNAFGGEEYLYAVEVPLSAISSATTWDDIYYSSAEIDGSMVEQIAFSLADSHGADQAAIAQCTASINAMKKLIEDMEGYIKSISTSDLTSLTKVALTAISTAEKNTENSDVVGAFNGLSMAEMKQLIIDNKGLLSALNPGKTAIKEYFKVAENLLDIAEKMGDDVATALRIDTKLVQWMTDLSALCLDAMTDETVNMISTVLDLAGKFADKASAKQINSLFDVAMLRQSRSDNLGNKSYTLNGEVIGGERAYEIYRTAFKTLMELYRSNVDNLNLTTEALMDVYEAYFEFIKRGLDVIDADDRLADAVKMPDIEQLKVAVATSLTVAKNVPDSLIDSMLQFVLSDRCWLYETVDGSMREKCVYSDATGHAIDAPQYNRYHLNAAKSFVKFGLDQASELSEILKSLLKTYLEVYKNLEDFNKFLQTGTNSGSLSETSSAGASPINLVVFLFRLKESDIDRIVDAAIKLCESASDADIEALLKPIAIRVEYIHVYSETTGSEYKYKYYDTNGEITREDRDKLERASFATFLKLMVNSSKATSVATDILEDVVLPVWNELAEERAKAHNGGVLPAPDSNTVPATTTKDIIAEMRKYVGYTESDDIYYAMEDVLDNYFKYNIKYYRYLR